MRAMVIDGFAQPSGVEEVPEPLPMVSEIVARIEASSLFHTDIRVTHGGLPVKPKLHLIV